MAGLLTTMKKRFNRKEQASQAGYETENSGARENPLERDAPKEEKPGRLLVVGRESRFSGQVMTYALEMAHRLSYEILALNTAPLSCETFKLFSSSRNKICHDFLNLSRENARKFSELAVNMRIPFEHIVKFKETDQAIAEIQQEKGLVDFVISDAEENRVTMRSEPVERSHREIFVYSVLQS